MLHPHHKLTYFKNLKRKDGWINNAHNIVQTEYKKNYEGKFNSDKAHDHGAPSDTEGDADIENDEEDKGEEGDGEEHGGVLTEDEDDDIIIDNNRDEPQFIDPDNEVSTVTYSPTRVRPRRTPSTSTCAAPSTCVFDVLHAT